MAITDLRDFLAILQEAGELTRIEETVDPDLEAGAIAQRLAERGGPAAHFINPATASSGVSLLAGSTGRGASALWSKVALALEIDPMSRYQTILEEVSRRRESPINPLQVADGPCKQVKLSGDEIDLEAFAPPVLQQAGGGRTMGSWAILVVQEPGGGSVHWDVVPLTVIDGKTLAGRPDRDSAVSRTFRDKYQANGQAMPFALVFGAAPLATLAATFRLGSDVTAAGIAGALQRSPVQLVKCESNDLLVPSSAELVLEGEVDPNQEAPAGPFPGSFGYATTTEARPSPVFHVTTVTHRADPIVPFCTWGTPMAEIHIARGLDCDSHLKLKFEKRGASVEDVFTPPWLAGSVIAISTKVPYTAYAQAVSGVVRVAEPSRNVPYILVCDNDIDITNPVSLFHAMVTKCHPDRDTWMIGHAPAAEDAPYLSAEERRLGKGARVIFDCTWPLDWDRSIAVPPMVSFTECYPKELQEKVISEWSAVLGFPNEIDRPA